jgi:diacylglycerol kinase family enzyme
VGIVADGRSLRVAVVVNPVSADDPSALRDKISALGPARGVSDLVWFETTEDSPGTEQAADARAQGAELVLVCGGDGTVRACAAALVGSEVALGLLPAGSGNLLARNLGVPLDLDAALEVAFGSGRLIMDVVESEAEPPFLIMAGLGFDAAMIQQTNQQTKERVGWLAYLGGIVRAVRSSPSVEFQIAIDGAGPVRRRAVGVLLGNVGSLQAGLAVLPEASPTDGLLDLAVLAPVAPLDWPLILGRMILRRMAKGGKTEVLRGRRFEISCDRELPLEFDGDAAGHSRSLIAAVRSGALTVCVPDD